MTSPGQTARTAQTPTDSHPPSPPPQHPSAAPASPPPPSEGPLAPFKCTQQVAPAGPPQPLSAHLSTCAAALQLRPGGRSLPLRFCDWPRGARLWLPRCREETLEKLLPMASAPRGCSGGDQARTGRSGGKVCKCVCARVRAGGGGPWRGCGRGRAVRCLRLSPRLAVFARRVLP